MPRASVHLPTDSPRGRHPDDLEKLRLAVQGSSDGLWVWDVGTEDVYFSPRFAELLEFTEAEFGDKMGRFNEQLHPQDFDRVWAAVKAHLADDTLFDIRYRLRTKRGEYRWFRARGKAFAGTAQRPRQMAGSIQDITDLVAAEKSVAELHAVMDQRVQQRTADLERANAELQREMARRQQVEDELRSSEAKFLDLYENAPDMYASVHPGSRTILQCNQTLLTTLGYTREELIGKDLMDVYHPDCAREGQAAFESFVRTGQAHCPQLTLRRKDGTMLQVSLRVRAVRDAQGNILHSRSAWRDITEQVETGRKLQQQEAQLAHVARVATMGEMATGLAHELNQPLQTISSYAQGCLERIQRGTLEPEQLIDAAQAVVAEAQRASAIISRLRAMVQRSAVTRDEVQINDVVREARQLLRADLDRHCVSVWETLPEDLPTLPADKIQLQQVVVNLIQNAAQVLADSNKGERIIRVETALHFPKHIALTVADNGPGIAGENRAKLFDAFFSTRPTGMGMGLPICRTIIEAHGGSISASNSPTGGAIFSVLLPLSIS